jgi:two-component system sensor histidine kinase QseC
MAEHRAELERLRTQLGSSLAREREFGEHLAHELRTPLAVLRMGLELSLRKHERGSAEHEHLRELLETTDEMRQMTDNLFMLARVEHDGSHTELKREPMRPLVDAVWRRLADKATTRKLSFDNAVADDHAIDADRGMLQIVVQNLLANAVSYTAQGGAIAVQHDGDVVLAVWDSGPQLPTDQLRRVFDRMWRADAARTDASRHVGLGLSLAQALCRRMALELAVENVASGGLRFVLRRAAANGLPGREAEANLN